jgi:hypothetical protein
MQPPRPKTNPDVAYISESHRHVKGQTGRQIFACASPNPTVHVDRLPKHPTDVGHYREDRSLEDESIEPSEKMAFLWTDSRYYHKIPFMDRKIEGIAS